MSPPKRTAVLDWPRVPVAGGMAVVTRGGAWSSLVHQRRYSALAQYRPGGPHGRWSVQTATPAIGLGGAPTTGVASHGTGPVGGSVDGVAGVAALPLGSSLSPF